MRISDWSSDVCSSDLEQLHVVQVRAAAAEVIRQVGDEAHARGLADEAQLLAGVGQGCETDRQRRGDAPAQEARSEEHTSELQSLIRISSAVFCLKKKQTNK